MKNIRNFFIALLFFPIVVTADCTNGIGDITIENTTYTDSIDCTASSSLVIGPNVTVQNPANINVLAPVITLKPPFSVAPGAHFNAFSFGSTATIKYDSAQSATFSQIGDSKNFSVSVYNSDGEKIIDAGDDISWTVSSPNNYQLSNSTGQTTSVSALTTAIGGTTLTATYTPLGISAQAQILTAELTPQAVYIESQWVQQHDTEESITLVRNAITENIKINDVLYSDNVAGILIKVTSVQINPNTVIVTGTPAALTDIYQRMNFSMQSQEKSLFLKYDFDSQTTTINGKGTSQTTNKSLLDSIRCKNTSGIDISMKITGGSISFKPTVSVDIDADINIATLESFHIKAILNTTVIANTGTLQFSSNVGVGTSCNIDLIKFTSPPVIFGPIAFSLQASPSLGLDVGAGFEGPSFTIKGPEGSVSGGSTAGICYAKNSGWTKCSEPFAITTNYQPPSAEFSTNSSFNLYASPYGMLEIGLVARAGPATLADVQFIELKAEAPFNFEFNSPFDPDDIAYTGPVWSFDTKVSGIYKAELSMGHLNDFLKRLGGNGVNLSGNITGDLFSPIENTILKSPEISMPPASTIFANVQTTFTINTDSNESMPVVFSLKSVDTQYVFIRAGTLVSGVENITWEPTNDHIGSYNVRAFVHSDALSELYPYAMKYPLQVEVVSCENLTAPNADQVLTCTYQNNKTYVWLHNLYESYFDYRAFKEFENGRMTRYFDRDCAIRTYDNCVVQNDLNTYSGGVETYTRSTHTTGFGERVTNTTRYNDEYTRYRPKKYKQWRGDDEYDEVMEARVVILIPQMTFRRIEAKVLSGSMQGRTPTEMGVDQLANGRGGCWINGTKYLEEVDSGGYAMCKSIVLSEALQIVDLFNGYTIPDWGEGNQL